MEIVLYILEVKVGNETFAHSGITVLLVRWMLWSYQELLAVCWLQHPEGLYLGFLIAIHMPESACKIVRYHIPLVGLLSCSANKYSVFLVWTETGCISLQKLPSVYSRNHELEYNQGKWMGVGKWVVHNARILVTLSADWQLLLVLTVCLRVTWYTILLQTVSVSAVESFVAEWCKAVTGKFISKGKLLSTFLYVCNIEWLQMLSISAKTRLTDTVHFQSHSHFVWSEVKYFSIL